jgi:transcriptional regulator with XRE-family HTH domain
MSNIASTNEGLAIGRRLAAMREERRLPQKEFAAKLGVSLRAYQNYERGEREISAGLIRALYDVFGIEPVWLLIGGGDPIRGRGEIDPTLAEAIAWEFGEAVQEVAKRDLELFPSWPLLGYRLALIYNRVIKRVKPGQPYGKVVAEEVRFLRDLAIDGSVSGKPPKVHPEELAHWEKLGISPSEVLGTGSATAARKSGSPSSARRPASAKRPGRNSAGAGTRKKHGGARRPRKRS